MAPLPFDTFSLFHLIFLTGLPHYKFSPSCMYKPIL